MTDSQFPYPQPELNVKLSYLNEVLSHAEGDCKPLWQYIRF